MSKTWLCYCQDPFKSVHVYLHLPFLSDYRPISTIIVPNWKPCRHCRWDHFSLPKLQKIHDFKVYFCNCFLGHTQLMATGKGLYSAPPRSHSLSAPALHASRIYSLVMIPTSCRVAECIISIRPTYSCARALTYLHRITSVLATDLWSSFLTFQRTICLQFHCLW